MPEEADQYLGEELLLPRRDDMARGQVAAQKCNAEDSVMGKVHANSVLDTPWWQNLKIDH